MSNEYVTVKIPKSLVDEIDKLIESKKRGYVSRTDVVKEALRILLRMEASEGLDVLKEATA
ncbi:MAG: ribbon-helix-helix domain-containing protein [Candidatus Bathyarchaeia archaeon]